MGLFLKVFFVPVSSSRELLTRLCKNKIVSERRRRRMRKREGERMRKEGREKCRVLNGWIFKA